MNGNDLLPYILTVAVMIVLVMAAGIVLFLIRGRLFGQDGPEDVGAGGVLEAMRSMRDRGEISEEEYRTTQAAIVAKATADRVPPRPPGTAPHPTKRRTPPAEPGELHAEPGYDLTGAPLPPANRGDSGEESA